MNTHTQIPISNTRAHISLMVLMSALVFTGVDVKVYAQATLIASEGFLFEKPDRFSVNGSQITDNVFCTNILSSTTFNLEFGETIEEAITKMFASIKNQQNTGTFYVVTNGITVVVPDYLQHRPMNLKTTFTVDRCPLSEYFELVLGLLAENNDSKLIKYRNVYLMARDHPRQEYTPVVISGQILGKRNRSTKNLTLDFNGLYFRGVNVVVSPSGEYICTFEAFREIPTVFLDQPYAYKYPDHWLQESQRLTFKIDGIPVLEREINVYTNLVYKADIDLKDNDTWSGKMLSEIQAIMVVVLVVLFFFLAARKVFHKR